MAYEAFQLNLKLTEAGYQRVFHSFGNPVNIKFIAIGSGIAGSGYDVAFREKRTSLVTEVLRKQIDSSQIEDITDPATGNPGKRVDYAAIFSGNSSFDIREVGFFDENNTLIYIWSSSTGDAFAPIRPKISLVVSIAQYLLIQEEMKVINIVDAGYPFELFIQPLKDQLAVDKLKIIEEVYTTVYERLRDAFYVSLCSITVAPITDNGDCLDIPLAEGNAINNESAIIARPLE